MINYDDNIFNEINRLLDKLFISVQSKYTKIPYDLYRTLECQLEINVADSKFAYSEKFDTYIFLINKSEFIKLHDILDLDIKNDNNVIGLKDLYIAGKFRNTIFINEDVMNKGIEELFVTTTSIIESLLAGNDDFKYYKRIIKIILSLDFVNKVFASTSERLDIDILEIDCKDICIKVYNEDREELFKYGKIFKLIKDYNNHKEVNSNG